jgi:hypothetical protein
MSKAIGWDIGIKNLAYCVLDTSLNSNTVGTLNTFAFNKTQYNITHWEDISLVTQIESNLATSGEVSHINNTLKCCFLKENTKSKTKKTNNKGKVKEKGKKKQSDPPTDIIEKNDIVEENTNSICGKSAFYCAEELNSDGTYKGYCKTHFKKLGVDRLPELSVKQCWNSDCIAKSIQVLKQHIFKGYCKKHINEMLKANVDNIIDIEHQYQYTSSDFLKINRAKATSKIDINNLGISLFQELDKIKNKILDAEIILLENQPVLKNPTMKSMQMFLYSYYLIRTMETNNGTMGNKKLQCYCASKKLDLIKFLPEGEQTRIMTIIDAVNNPYQKNKKLSIHIVEYLLKDNKKLLDFFNGNTKKDDLADSLLMTLHYFEKANLIKIRKDDKKEEKKVQSNIVKKEEQKEEDKKVTKINVKGSKKKKKKNGSKELEILEIIQEE